MKKRLIVIPILVVFIFSTFIFSKSASAYQNNAYYGSIRVGLTIMAAPSMLVTLNGNYTLGNTRLPSGTKFTLYVRNGKVIYNGQAYNSLTLVPDNPKTTVTLESKPYYFTYIRNYMGTLNFKDVSGEVFPINTLNIEDYLLGVIGYEMSEAYDMEALKAQAIVSRTYALYELGKYNSRGYDVTDTTDCQVYHGYNSYYSKVAEAVADTKGVVLVYNYGTKTYPNEKLVAAFFEASDGGSTEACQNVWLQSFPYLTEEKDDYDNYNWTTTFTNYSLESRLKSYGYLSSSDKFERIDLGSISKYPSGRISNITIDYETGSGYQRTESFGKDYARIFLGLKSALYTVTYSNGVYTFTGKGYGHGLGLSQIGAENRAEAGQTAEEILSFYYKNAYLVELNSDIKSFTESANQVETGGKITFNAVLQGNSTSDYMYKYVIEHNGSTVYTRDYSFEPSVDYTPTQPGAYTAVLYIKNRYSDEDYDDTSSLLFSAFSPPVITGITAAPDKINAGDNVNINTTVTGGSSKGFQYTYIVTKSGSTVTSSTTTYPSFSFTPLSGGQYQVEVRVKDNLSSSGYDSLKTISINVNSSAPVLFSTSRTLSLGMIGNDVESLQRALKSLGCFNYYTTTTYFGDVTRSAVIAFQSKYGLAQNGIVDGSTASKINEELVNLSQPKPPVNTDPSRGTETAFSLSRTLSFGMIGNDVEHLQSALKSLGCFDYYTTTTFFGDVTRSAVVAFQRKNGLPQNGIADGRVAALINTALLKLAESPGTSSSSGGASTSGSSSYKEFNPSRSLITGMSGSDVSQLQQILKNFGYFNYPSITGYFGLVTLNAVEKFQRANGIDPIGVVGPLTRAKINAKLK